MEEADGEAKGAYYGDKFSANRKKQNYEKINALQVGMKLYANGKDTTC